MKKIWLVLFLFIFTSAQAADSITFQNFFTAGHTIAASASSVVNVSPGSEGYFSVQPVFTGDGVLKISYQTSNNNIDWSPAAQIIDIAVSKTVYSYPDSGADIFAGYQRLVFTETGGSDTIIISGVYRCAQ